MLSLPHLFRRKRPAVTAKLDLPSPIAVIGDIHGCCGLLLQLLDRLAAEAPDASIVCVGDYIDRGDHSADVIDLLMQRPDVRCLKGNHEAMCLGFLDHPTRGGMSWLRNGGLQTLASYGIAGPVPGTDRTLKRVRDDLALAMGDARIDWLRALPPSCQSGNLLITHAGADPERTPEDQRLKDLLWGCANFMTKPRTDGLWVAFGHVIQDAPSAESGRIAVDTGAYATGMLTAAILGDGPPRFVTT